jgi:hypothetical protein
VLVDPLEVLPVCAMAMAQVIVIAMRSFFIRFS